MKTINELRTLPVMFTGSMIVWWDYALDNWDDLCCEESIYGGESRGLPKLPKTEFIPCYLKLDSTNSLGDFGWDVRLTDYISALHSNGSLKVQFPDGIKEVSIDKIIPCDDDVKLTIEFIRDGFFCTLDAFDNNYKGYVDSEGTLVAITCTNKETGAVSVLLPEHISYDKTFGISLEKIKEYLYNDEPKWNHWSEEVVGE